MGGGGRFSVDEVRHSLCLNEVHPSVEEGLLGELAALGLPGALGEQGVQPLVQHHRGAVAVDLGAVLAGVAVGAGEQHRQSAVYDAPLPVVEIPQHHPPGGLSADGAAVGGGEYDVQDTPGVRAGQTQDADGGGQLRCGDGGNGIGHGSHSFWGMFHGMMYGIIP